jgi:3-hydroxyisobutyrate dehydrogenase
LLEALGDPHRIIHVGGPGAGYITKLLVNLLWFGQAVATAEALLLGKRAEIDLGLLRTALADSAAAGDFIRRDLEALLAGGYMRSFGLDRCYEELANVSAQARSYGLPFELSDLVGRIFGRAVARYGPVEGKLPAVALLEDAGIQLRSCARERRRVHSE